MASPTVAQRTNRVFVSNLIGTPPGNAATTVLFCTHPRAPGGVGAAVGPSTFVRASGTETVQVAPDAITKLKLVYHLHDQASAANGLRAYQTSDGGVTWEETDMKGYVGGVANQPSIGAAAPIQVPLLAAGQEWAEEFDISRYRGFALEETAGAVGPTPGTGWKVSMEIELTSQED